MDNYLTGMLDVQMLRELKQALGEQRVRASSNRGVFKSPNVYMTDPETLRVTGSDGSFSCSLSMSGAILHVDGKPCACTVNGSSLGAGGVWIQISGSNASNFWLELNVSVPTLRQLQTRDPR